MDTSPTSRSLVFVKDKKDNWYTIACTVDMGMARDALQSTGHESYLGH